jgi:hypothetical protein
MPQLPRARVVPCLLLALAALLAWPSGVGAVPDQIVREHYSGTDEDVPLCGLTVDISFEGTFRATIHEWVIGPNDETADNWWLGTINDHGSATITNVANGESVTQTWVNNIQEASLVDLGNGDWQFTFAHSGIPIRIGGGRPIDVGRIIITQTIHFGDLSTQEDTVFFEPEALFDAGRHPAFYSEGPFCDAIIAAIG